MATLRNDGSSTHLIQSIDGTMVSVGPGITVETYSVSARSLPGMIVVDEAPYYNPALSRSDPASAGPGDDKEIEVVAAAKSIEIINNSGVATITVFLDSTANMPGLKVVAQSKRTIGPISGKVAKLILQFSGAIAAGECFVTQLR